MNKKSNRGFTIVELLVVIVVIGILAAITIVSYSGITARANGAKALSNAQAAQSVAEVFYTEDGYYPASSAEFLAGSTTNGTAKLPASIGVIADTGTTIASTAITGTDNDKTRVAIACVTAAASCAAGITAKNITGIRIAYWDFGATTPAVKYLYAGTFTSATLFAGMHY